MSGMLFTLMVVMLSMVASAPVPQNRDSELITGPVQLPSFPDSLALPGDGSVIGEVLVSSPNVAVKRSKKNKDKSQASGPSFAARTSSDTAQNFIGDTVFFSQPSAVIQTS
ncbi:uncharacterized protein LOC108678402 [Hyalella azteca]|uniref:Uncharacterized protein LOC108678402 n=1 Tax=Hyalella azteca TaxID=294128 RepID=A0A8B7PAT1_HYAAZ|nr:uncharacterized protein LOC108678402 [Hyalella azteca]